MVKATPRTWWAATLAAVFAVMLLSSCATPRGDAAPRRIVLIGGVKSEGPGRHDYPDGIRQLKSLLAASTTQLAVVAYENGWPDDPAAFDGAAAVVLYFDGLDQHPLRDAARRRQFDALMARGAGLVALHQASAVPADDALIGLQRWLGAARFGTHDRSTETTTLWPATPSHPINRGVGAFVYRDEFYPTLRFTEPGRVTPILSATLHVQYRNGRRVLADISELTTVAWAFERAQGGRSFGFTGGHFLASLDEPMLRKTLLNAVLWTAGVDVPAAALRAEPAPAQSGAAAADATTFHRNPQRTGWFAHERVLTPANVAGPSFGALWQSPPLDALDGQAPRLYASPLTLERVTISAGPHRGETFSVVFAASNHGFVYAINAAAAGDVAPGRILWRTRLAAPCRLQPAALDAVPTGVLSTPVIDAASARLYVTSCDPAQRWQAYALDITSGAVLPGWPLRLDEARLNAVNRNAGPAPVAPTRRFDFRVQRGALNLSPDGSRLYVTFGETETGWLVSVDTRAARVASAFAAVAMPRRGSGGLWGAGGPAVDVDGRIVVVTGSGFDGFAEQAHDWTQSVLQLSDSPATGLKLEGSYTPFNHCATAKMDIDLGSGGAALLPDLDAATTATPRLMVVGGKQGNAYLLNRERLPGWLDRRPPCSSDAASDASLLPPQRQPHFAGRGPLNVFGPYSEADAALDSARSRSVPATFRAADGASYIYLTGSTRAGEGSPVSVPPSLVRLEVVTAAQQPAYLRLDRAQAGVVFENPGSPVVTSNGSADAIVWVLDQNARRSTPLVGPDAPAPVLYAFDATTLALLWRSAPGELHTSGKYNEPAFARGAVLVGTDRIQAFGLDAQRKPGAGAPPVAGADSGATADARAIYAQRCAMCHDHAQGGIPPRAWIAARPRSSIVEALTHGAMRTQAAGLSRRDIEALADYLK